MFNNVERTEKVSEGIITQIRNLILSGEIKPGDKLASEKVLMEQFGVSKASLREALRVLEAMGLIEIKKGTAGGVFIAEVSMRETINSILNFLHFQHVSTHEITIIRCVLEPWIAHIAASKRTEEDIQKLRKTIIQSEKGLRTEASLGITFHRYLARITKNPMLILIIDFMDGYLRQIKTKLNLPHDFFDSVCKHHHVILECLIQKDSFAASIAMIQDVMDVHQYMVNFSNEKEGDHLYIKTLIPQMFSSLFFKPNSKAVVVSKDDPCMKQSAAFFKQVGTSDLYVAFLPY